MRMCSHLVRIAAKNRLPVRLPNVTRPFVSTVKSHVVLETQGVVRERTYQRASSEGDSTMELLVAEHPLGKSDDQNRTGHVIITSTHFSRGGCAYHHVARQKLLPL